MKWIEEGGKKRDPKLRKKNAKEATGIKPNCRQKEERNIGR